MSKRNYVFLMALTLAAVLTTGGLLASNMGFKITYTLNGAGSGGWVSGENTLALPFLPQLGITDAATLQGDIQNDCAVTPAPIQRFDPTSGFRQSWFGGKIGGTNFVIPTGCECYFVQMPAAAACSYVAVGSHDPAKQCTFNGAGVAGFVIGENPYGVPYHTTALNASDLRGQIPNVSFVQRYEPTTGARESWFGAKIGGTNFALAPGECYFIQMAAGVTTTLTPEHF
jgi:hypothetical protein